MKGRLVAMIVPASVASVALGASAAAHKGGTIPPNVWLWLWPSLVALVWLSLGIGALVMRWTKWAWPPLAAFLVQFIGILLMWARIVRTPLDILWYSIGTFVVVLVVILVVWLVVTLRTRALERRLVEGGGEGVDAQALARIRKDMAEALTMLRRTGTGRNAIYELPWLLVMGRPQGGKTFAIKNSGLSLPVRRDWVKGAGGTFTADWFFTNEMIFLDTPGKWVQEGVSEEGSKNWVELLRLLRRHRGRRPLDGLVVVVPADDLMSKSREELAEQAAHVREVIDLIHDELKFRFPVYLLVSKTDLVDGFIDFFKGLPANRKHQVFGWSHPDPNDRDAIGSIRKAFGRVVRRMQAIRLEILARTASATGVRRLFFFTEEFRRLEDPLVEFAEVLFQNDPYHETPVFRGFYFTSATQGEGAPLGQAMAQLARNLGVRSAPPAAGEAEAKRSYFLLELFRTLIVGDEGLVSRTAGHWLRRRRDTVLAAFLPATVAIALLFFATISYFWNRAIYRDAAEEIPRIVADLETKNDVSSDALEALQDIERIREYHEKMVGFSLFRRLGMRQPDEMETETFRIFRDELQSRVLGPTFSRAQEIALDPGTDFATRADAFYAVVWLRQAHMVESGDDDLKGFVGIWTGLDPESQTPEARELLVTQFEHLLRYGPTDKDLLRGFDLAKVAEALRKGTADIGSTSAITRYIGFQDACASVATPNAIRRCNQQLDDTLSFGANDIRRLSKNLQKLKRDLRSIKDKEVGADGALASLGDISLPEAATEQCFQTFEREIVPKLKDYVDRQEALIKACQSVVDQKGKGEVHRVLDAQDIDLKKQQETILKAVADFNENCAASLQRIGNVDVAPAIRISRDYRRIECVREANLVAAEVKKFSPPSNKPVVVHGGGGAVVRHVVPGVGVLEFFTRGGVPSGYNQDAIDQKKTQFSQDILYAEGLSPAEKAANDAQIRKRVDEYGIAYVRTWEQYLRAIRLKGNPPADPGAWLQSLSQSPEWRTVLSPASDALGVAGDPADAYFGSIYRRLGGMSNVSTFLNSGLGTYSAHLQRLGEDVTRCRSNPTLAAEFRSKLDGHDPTNSLVKAQDWVNQNGGESLAQGSLRALLQRPLDVARDALGSSADPNKRWVELVRASEQLSHRFPFSGSETDDLASPDEVKAVFGGLSGMVTKLCADKDKLQLSDASRAWLEQAQGLSQIFFDPASDTIKTFNLRLAFNEKDARIEPDKAAKAGDWRLEEFEFELPDPFNWKAETEAATSKMVTLELFGEKASGSSKIKVTVGHADRKGITRKLTWEEAAPPTVVASEDGAWAPLRTLAKIKPAGASGDRFTIPLQASFPFKTKTPPDGRLTVALEVQGRQLATLLDLARTGFKPAPATP